VVERGVEVKLLAAALHYAPKTLRFLKSLASIDGIAGSMHVVGGRALSTANCSENFQSAR
jgi:hypothetical protein